MDPVRFGRALGLGARLAAQTAAQTAVTAVDAALAPNPATTSSNPTPDLRSAQQAATSSPNPVATTRLPANQPKPSQAARPQPSPTQPHQALPSPRRLTQSLTAPLRRLSGVLWLEFTGVFFGLFAAAAALGAWRLRAAWRLTPTNATNHSHLLLTSAVAALFTYFCVSSFHRARRRNRQP